MNAKYLIIDTEATGLHNHKHALIQLAAAALDEKLEIVDTLNYDINPPKPYQIDPQAMMINGFTTERIEAGISYPEAAKNFIDFVKANFVNKPIAVAQFYPFDYGYLDMLFTKTGYEEAVSKEILGNDFIDTKSLVCTLNMKAELEDKPLPFKSTSLSKKGGLKDILKIEGEFVAHDAMADVLATREVLVKLMDFLP